MYRMHLEDLQRRGKLKERQEQVKTALAAWAAPNNRGGAKHSRKAQTRQATRIHTVKRGDTLYGIGRRYGVSADRLRRINGLDSRAVIRPGQRLRVSP